MWVWKSPCPNLGQVADCVPEWICHSRCYLWVFLCIEELLAKAFEFHPLELEFCIVSSSAACIPGLGVQSVWVFPHLRFSAWRQFTDTANLDICCSPSAPWHLHLLTSPPPTFLTSPPFDIPTFWHAHLLTSPPPTFWHLHLPLFDIPILTFWHPHLLTSPPWHLHLLTSPPFDISTMTSTPFVLPILLTSPPPTFWHPHLFDIPILLTSPPFDISTSHLLMSPPFDIPILLTSPPFDISTSHLLMSPSFWHLHLLTSPPPTFWRPHLLTSPNPHLLTSLCPLHSQSCVLAIGPGWAAIAQTAALWLRRTVSHSRLSAL